MFITPESLASKMAGPVDEKTENLDPTVLLEIDNICPVVEANNNSPPLVGDETILNFLGAVVDVALKNSITGFGTNPVFGVMIISLSKRAI